MQGEDRPVLGDFPLAGEDVEFRPTLQPLRLALGEEKISIHGLSYGTLLGSTYATLFPQHTDKMVLDSGVDPDWMWNQVLLEQNEPYKQRAHAMFDWIAANDAVYGLGDTPLKVYQRWTERVLAESGTTATLAPPPARVGDVPAEWQALAQAMEARGVPAVVASRLRPWYVAMMLGLSPCMLEQVQAQGGTGGLDHLLIGRALDAGVRLAVAGRGDLSPALRDTLRHDEDPSVRAEAGVMPDRLAVRRRSLEDVFLDLTGRDLR